MLLEDAAIDWGDVDATAVRQMIAEADAEGGEIPFDEAIRELDKVIAAPRPLTWRTFSFVGPPYATFSKLAATSAPPMRLRRSDFERR